MSQVSICIPAYKDVEGIRRLLGSIYDSEYTDFEVILSDDTPGREISDLLEDFELPIRYVHNKKPLGPAKNWNQAISMAKSPYVKIMHQDDWFTHSLCLGRFVEMLDENRDVDLAFSGTRQVSINKNDPEDLSDFYDRAISPVQRTLIQQDYRNLFLGGFIGSPSAVIFRQTDARFDEKLRWLIDSDFYMQVLSEGSGFVNDRSPLVCIGVSNTQLSHTLAQDKDINIYEHRYLFKKYKLDKTQEYRDKLIDVCVSYNGKYSDISDLGITKEEYKSVYRIHAKRQRKFIKQLILRKLHLSE
ncbi:MAG: glycosyltransferase family 2 protein [Lachnospiraceae bacterium]|nr:glycosyltransferase family 2 protein [Lachnospiraceae bacterium]